MLRSKRYSMVFVYFVYFLFCLFCLAFMSVLFVCLLVGSDFHFLLGFLFVWYVLSEGERQRKQEHEFDWVWRKGGPKRIWGSGKNMIKKMYCVKKLLSNKKKSGMRSQYNIFR